MQQPPSLLPDALSAALERLKSKFDAGRSVTDVYPEVLAGLSSLSPALIGPAEREIVFGAGLYHGYSPAPLIPRWSLRLTQRQQLERVPGLEFLFLLHRDGHLREAALHKLTGPVPSAALFVMLAWRLNDWVPQVRAAAVACAVRTFPLTTPEVIAEAATLLLQRNATWRRWDKERAQLTTSLDRPDVALALVDRIMTQTTGPSATILRAALRGAAMDSQLVRLSRDAIQPAVRALATQAPDRWLRQLAGRLALALDRKANGDQAGRNRLCAPPTERARRTATDDSLGAGRPLGHGTQRGSRRVDPSPRPVP